ncbi:ATPase-like protein, partial [Kickxella alabastrina]
DGAAVELDNCVLSWGDNKFALDPITLRVKASEFVMIVGRIGGGKSSLLSRLCGEMSVVGGHGRICGKIGYVSQKPYIMNDTFRENVLEACALSGDVKQFAAGDLSEIGPNGINLSGGQKVRLALLKADVYIFDDLLAAVDVRVECLIVKRVLASGGIIGDKTHILVTHAEHLEPLSSKVIMLTGGYAEIVEHDGDKDNNGDDKGKSGEFIIHPKLEAPPFKLTQLWKFLELSGYMPVAIVVLIQFTNVYAIYYVESLHTELMVDDNPDTMHQSMSKHLIVNALTGIGPMQLGSLENWIRDRVLTKPLLKIMRHQIIGVILSLPLTLVESLSHFQLIRMFIDDRIMITSCLPRTLCNCLLFNGLSTASSILHVIKTSPMMLLLCLPLVDVTTMSQVFFKTLSETMRKLEEKYFCGYSTKFDELLLHNRTLLQIHRHADYYLDRFRTAMAAQIYYDYVCNILSGSREIMSTICIELINSSTLLFNVYRHLYTDIPVLAGEVDVTISLSLNVFHQVFSLIHMFSGFEEEVQALSRYYIYTEQLECEAPGVIGNARSEPSWPQSGMVEFRNYSMRYRSELNLVFKGLSFSAQGGEKIGTVGRTGAGKSSLTYALMRLVKPASGQIIIDGIDISTIRLHDLRSCIPIIPQVPALFKGTIRDNLDPANKYTDDKVWAAICVGLNKWVEEGGSNFSVGQRQLISLCRALLWRCKIVILDEATADVDSKTDQTMQDVIRREFKDCTVMNSDRILVMDHGQMAEFDIPENLLTDKNSYFSQLVESMKLNHGN